MNRWGRSNAVIRLVRRHGTPKCHPRQVISSPGPRISDARRPMARSPERAIEPRWAATESDRSNAAAGGIASLVTHSNRTGTTRRSHPLDCRVWNAQAGSQYLWPSNYPYWGLQPCLAAANAPAGGTCHTSDSTKLPEYCWARHRWRPAPFRNNCLAASISLIPLARRDLRNWRLAGDPPVQFSRSSGHNGQQPNHNKTYRV